MTKRGDPPLFLCSERARPFELGDNTIKIKGLNADAVTNAAIESMGRALADGDLVVIKTAGNKAVDVRPLGSNAVQQLPEDSILFKAEGVGHDGKNLIYTRLPKETLESTKLNEADEAGRVATQAGKEGGKGEDILSNTNKVVEGAGSADSDKVLALSTRFLNRMDPLWSNADKIKPLEGYQDIVCHGDKMGFSYKDLDGNETILTAREFAEMLEDSPVYKGGPIRLIACEAGADGSITAQYLADRLGVEVLAPTNIVFVDPNGKIVIGPDQWTNIGTWKAFKPRK